jgi:hypothetical protein
MSLQSSQQNQRLIRIINIKPMEELKANETLLKMKKIKKQKIEIQTQFDKNKKL